MRGMSFNDQQANKYVYTQVQVSLKSFSASNLLNFDETDGKNDVFATFEIGCFRYFDEKSKTKKGKKGTDAKDNNLPERAIRRSITQEITEGKDLGAAIFEVIVFGLSMKT